MISDILKRFQKIDILIRESQTGTPVELAKKIGVSERTIYQYIKVMKKLGASIEFNVLTKTYYYKEEGDLVLPFSSSADSNKSKRTKQDINQRVISIGEFIEQVNKNITLNNN